MGGAPGVGDRRPRGDARCGKSLDHPLHHGVFPAMEMGGAGRVDHQSVSCIGRDDRRIMLQRPEREPVEGSRVGRWLRVLDEQARHQRLRLGPGMPTRKPARCAAASAARTTRRLPSRPITTSGASAGGAASPNFLLTRSVDQVGRKSETTLGITGLHFEIGTFTGTTPDQFDLPSGASNAGNRQGG
jgi:hypothetical protein